MRFCYSGIFNAAADVGLVLINAEMMLSNVGCLLTKGFIDRVVQVKAQLYMKPCREVIYEDEIILLVMLIKCLIGK